MLWGEGLIPAPGDETVSCVPCLVSCSVYTASGRRRRSCFYKFFHNCFQRYLQKMKRSRFLQKIYKDLCQKSFTDSFENSSWNSFRNIPVDVFKKSLWVLFKKKIVRKFRLESLEIFLQGFLQNMFQMMSSESLSKFLSEIHVDIFWRCSKIWLEIPLGASLKTRTGMCQGIS